MKIAFLTQWFDPEAGSAAIPGAMVRALQARGHDVEVITGFPNYPHGEVYDGYRVRPLSRETIRGTQVHRVALYPSHDRSPIRRALNFISFMTTASTIGAWIARRSQVTLVYSTPGTVGLAGIVLRRLLSKPFVLYIQDVWPDTVTATGMVPERFVRPVERVLGLFCNRVYSAASQIAVISPGMKELLVSRGVPEDKVHVVYNWVDEELFRPVPARGRHGSFEVMYAGNIGDVQGLEVVVRAIALLDDLPNVRLRMVGSGVALGRLQALARDLGVEDRVRFEGPRDIRQMAGVMADADVQLVCLSDDPLFHITMPSKIQAILACGRPLIASAPGDAGRLAAESGAGFAVPAGDAPALASAIRGAAAMPAGELTEMGRRGRQYYETHLSAAVGARMLERALARAVIAGRTDVA